MRTSDTLKSITAALFKFQEKVIQPHKNEVADTGKFKYEYITLQALKEHIKPLMQECGLVFVSCGLTSRVIHPASGEWIEGEFVCSVEGLDAQKCGAVGSYARRYNLQGLLDICAEEDDDATAATQAQQQKKRPVPGATASGTPANDSPAPASNKPSRRGPKELKEVNAKILRITENPGTNRDTGEAYTRYGIHTQWPDGTKRWMNTFSDTLGSVANECLNSEQKLVYSTKMWNNEEQYVLESIER